MPDKLTDKEIVKALEEYAAKYNLTYIGKQAKIILDLINRLQADIRETRRDLLNEIYVLEHQLKTAKAEAYKEFAERLKHKAINIGVNDSIVSTYAIDETLKELVGEDNDRMDKC